jgi:hypothetical protein
MDQGIISQHTTNNTPAPTTTATDESVDPGSFPNADAAADIPAPTTTATDESINPGSFPNANTAANDPGSLLNADAAASNPGSLPNNDAAANIPAPITTAINKSIDPGSLLDADAAANRSGPATSDSVNFVPVSSSGSNDTAVTTEADCAYDLDEDLVIVSKSSVPNAFEQNSAPTSSLASSTSAKHSVKQLGEDNNVVQSADEKAADNARLAWIRQELGKMTKERRQYNAEAIALQMKLYPNNDGGYSTMSEPTVLNFQQNISLLKDLKGFQVSQLLDSSILANLVTGCPIMITDEPRVRYKKPTSFEKIHRMRISHIANMSRLSDAIAVHFKPTIDADDSADYREGRGIQRKRGFNDFLSAELRDNSIANQLVGKLVSEVCEYRKKLKGV